jgi:hypothetical protein
MSDNNDIIDDTPSNNGSTTTDQSAQQVIVKEPHEVPVVAETKADEKVGIPEMNRQSVRIEYSIAAPGEIDPKKSYLVLDLPTNLRDVWTEQLRAAPNIDLRTAGANGKVPWDQSVRESLEFMRKDEGFLRTLEDPTAEFGQYVKYDNVELKPGAPKFGSVSGETLDGDRAVFRFLSHMEMGAVFRMPLWNTGMWLTLKSPGEDALLEMNRRMLNEKIDLGRETDGAVYSNFSVFAAQVIMSTVMENIYQMNLKTDKNPLTLISVHDIIPLAMGLAATIWNNGFVYRRACTHDVAKCTHVVEEKLDISKLLFVNRKALSPKQLAIMAKTKNGDITEADLVAYREENYKSQSRNVVIRKGQLTEFMLRLRVPSVMEHFESGNVWINDLKDSVNKTLTIDAGDNERNTFLDQHSKATMLRQYIHWIEGIQFGEDNMITEREALQKIMNRLSSQDDVRDEIITAIREYIDHTSLTVVGVPTYKCPSCKGENKVKGTQEAFEGIIPLDVYNTFFLLLVQAVGRIISRR